jgi:oligopeptide transport system substrate-binding protein
VVAVLAAGAAACDRDKGSNTSQAIRRGGALRIAVPRPATFDPMRARSVEQILVTDQLFDSLTAYEAGDLRAVPSLAARWDVSPDQKEWDFHLRPNARFSNGSPITATDVKFTIERIARPASGASVADQLQLFRGLAEFQSGAAPELAGVAAPAPERVHISLTEPLADLPSLLGNPAFGVVSKQQVEGAGAGDAFIAGGKPVSSGPFQVFQATDRSTVLTKGPGSRAYVDRVELVHLDDEAASYTAFKEGQLDWTRIPPNEFAAARQQYGTRGFHPYTGELFYAFNFKNPKFQDRRYREAIVRAVDRRAIVRAVFSETVLPLDGAVVRDVPGWQESACGGACEYDPARSRALVAELAAAGTPAPELAIDFDAEPTQEAIARAIQANLNDVGIKANLRPTPELQYQEALGGQQELFRLAWIAAYPSAEAFVAPLFMTGAADNLSGFSLKAVDDGIRAARAEPDLARRLDAYRNVERTLMDALPVLPIAQYQILAVTSRRVRGFRPTAIGSFDASTVWLSAE